MTLPHETCSAIVRAEALLVAIMHGKGIGNETSLALRDAARKCLRHYPGCYAVAEMTNQAPESARRTADAWRKEYMPPIVANGDA